jgi:hypothetical protein
MKYLTPPMLQKIISCVLLLTVFILIPTILYGQPGLPDDPEQAPIDGGLSILAAAGGAYAIKKIRDKKE